MEHNKDKGTSVGFTGENLYKSNTMAKLWPEYFTHRNIGIQSKSKKDAKEKFNKLKSKAMNTVCKEHENESYNKEFKKWLDDNNYKYILGTSYSGWLKDGNHFDVDTKVLIKMFDDSKVCREHELSEWQLCPKCNGSGIVACGGTISTSPFMQCDVCFGAKVLAKPTIDTIDFKIKENIEVIENNKWEDIESEFEKEYDDKFYKLPMSYFSWLKEKYLAPVKK